MKTVTGVKQQQLKNPTMNSYQKTQEYIKGKSPLFILQKKSKNYDI